MPGRPRSRSAGVVRNAPRSVMKGAMPLISPGSTGSASTGAFPASRDSTSTSPSSGSSEQLEKTIRPPGFTSVMALSSKPPLQRRQLGNILERFGPRHVRMAAHRSGGRAGCIQKNRVEERRRLVLHHVRFHDVRGKTETLQIGA